MNKTEKRKIAREKRKKKKLIITASVFAAIAAVILLFIFVITPLTKGNDRVYISGMQSITLKDNGEFNARLAHGNTYNGTYAESTDRGYTTIWFTANDRTVSARVEDDILILPSEWDDGHGHGSRFKLK